MPHIIVMHSLGARLDEQDVSSSLHTTLSTYDSVKPTTVKTYVLPITHCVVGIADDPDDMIHIQVRMKPGRAQDEQKDMAQALHDYTRAYLNDADLAATVSVEIHELDEPTYTSSHF